MKKEAALIILAILLKNNFSSYYIGSKSRNELNNQFFPDDKLVTEDYHIFTNANDTDVTDIFENSEVQNDILNTVLIKFGGHEFEISTCPQCIDKDDVCLFMDERGKRDITINTIAQNIDGQFVDYTYMYRNQKISAIKDLQERKIRSVGNPYQRFADDPSRIIRIFRIMAQTGYDIEKTTLKAASLHLDLLKNISTMQIGEEFNKLIIGKAAAQAILKMKQIGFFKAKIYNPFIEKHVEILPVLKTIKDEQLIPLAKYNNYRHHRDGYNRTLDCWTLLFHNLNQEDSLRDLNNLHPVNFDDMEKIAWMLNHYDVIHQEDVKQSIFNSKDGIVMKNKFFTLHELIGKLLKINIVMDGLDGHELSKKVWFEFCSRPYFTEQISSKELIEVLNIEDESILENLKESLLPKLLFSAKYPRNKEFEKIVLETANEIGIIRKEECQNV